MDPAPSALPKSRLPPANPLAANSSDVRDAVSQPPPPKPTAEVKRDRPLGGVAFVMDVPVELSVEIGRRRTRIAELLQLATGSVLELDSAAGDPLSIYVNKRLIARGEAVMVGDRYGVRIVELLVDTVDQQGGVK